MPLAHHAVVLEQSKELVEAFGSFWEVAGTIPFQSGDLALEDTGIDVAEGIALPAQPPAKRLASAQIALDAARCIPLLVEQSREILQVRSQRTVLQLGDDMWPCKEVFKHMSLLFPHD